MKKLFLLLVLILAIGLTSCSENPVDSPVAQPPSSETKPLVELLALPDTIVLGQSTTLNWSSKNATSSSGNGFNTGGTTSGSVAVTPTVTTNYTITVTGVGGTSTTSRAVVVKPAPISGPVITVQPVSQTVLVGDNVTLSVGASGTLIAYQWKLNGTDVPGATNSSLTISNAQPTNAGNYAVVVYNTSNSVMSSVATVSVQLAVGRPYLGGIIIHLDSPTHGLVAATHDQSDPTRITHTLVEANQLCSNYGIGYRMPDSTELELIRQAKYSGILGNFVSPLIAPEGYYDCSWESPENPGWYLTIGFNNGEYHIIHGFINFRGVLRF